MPGAICPSNSHCITRMNTQWDLSPFTSHAISFYMHCSRKVIDFLIRCFGAGSAAYQSSLLSRPVRSAAQLHSRRISQVESHSHHTPPVFLTAAEDGLLQVCDARTAALVRTLRHPIDERVTVEAVTGVDVLDVSTLLSVTAAGALYEWHIADGILPDKAVLARSLTAVIVTSSQVLAATKPGDLLAGYWDGTLLHSFRKVLTTGWQGQPVRRMAHHPPGIMVASSDSAATVLNADLHVRAVLLEHDDSIFGLAMDPTVYLSCGIGNTLYVYDAATLVVKREIRVNTLIYAVDLSGDETYAVFGTQDRISVFEVVTRRQR